MQKLFNNKHQNNVVKKNFIGQTSAIKAPIHKSNCLYDEIKYKKRGETCNFPITEVTVR